MELYRSMASVFKIIYRSLLILKLIIICFWPTLRRAMVNTRSGRDEYIRGDQSKNRNQYIILLDILRLNLSVISKSRVYLEYSKYLIIFLVR